MLKINSCKSEPDAVYVECGNGEYAGLSRTTVVDLGETVYQLASHSLYSTVGYKEDMGDQIGTLNEEGESTWTD